MSQLNFEKDTLALGEQTKVYYKLIFSNDVTIEALDFSLLDSIESLIKAPDDTLNKPYYAEIEWEAGFMNFSNKKLKLDPSELISTKGQFIYADTFNCIFWDIGQFSFPPPRVIVDSLSKDIDNKYLQSALITVFPPLGITNPDTSSMILDIKPIIEEETTLEDYFVIIYAAIALLIIALFSWLIWRRNKKNLERESIIEVIRPPHEIAMEDLESLRRKKLWQSGHIKAYQTELTHIIREYLERRYGILALESTTDQILKSLKDFQLDLSNQNTLRQILQIADLVKFAKAQPPADLHDQFLDKAEVFILETKNEILEDPENITTDE